MFYIKAIEETLLFNVRGPAEIVLLSTSDTDGRVNYNVIIPGHKKINYFAC